MRRNNTKRKQGFFCIRNYFKKNPLPGTERVIEQTLERVRIRSKFLRRIKAEFG